MDDQPKKGMGCFAKGCLIVVVAGLLVVGGLCFGVWHFYKKTVATFTADVPVALTVIPPTDAEYSSADAALGRLREAIARQRDATIEFSAADLNALVNRHPDFADLRGRFRFDIANSIMTLEMSVPMDSVALPKLKGRWFNGTARFSFVYEQGTFAFEPKSVEAAGHQLPSGLMSPNVTSSFNKSFSKSFQDAIGKNQKGSGFWKQIKSMTLRDDKLIISTGPGGLVARLR